MYFVVVAGELDEQPIIGAVVLFLFTFEYYGCKFTKKKNTTINLLILGILSW